MTNIFRRGHRWDQLADIIPTAVTEAVAKGSTTSCEFVVGLPPFQMVAGVEEEMQFMQNAARYQLEWTEKMSA